MDEQTQRIKGKVAAAAERLTRAEADSARLHRRKEFLAELKKHGNWLAKGPAEAPAWVKPWNEYYAQLATAPEYLAVRAEIESARAALHSPEFEAAIELLRLGEAGEPADWSIAYLEADPWYFRSGYFKASLARWLRQVELSEEQRDRLRGAVLNNLPKGPRLDFTETRKLARRLDTPEFRAALERLSTHPDAGTADRARRLLAACALNDTPGRDLRHEHQRHANSPSPATEESGEGPGGEGAR